MAWYSPPSWVSGQPITSAFLNGLRDALLETAPAKATAAGGYFASTGLNSIAERQLGQAYDGTGANHTSTSYDDLTGSPGPAVTVTTGIKALIFLTANLTNTTVNQGCYMAVDITGATTNAPGDGSSLRYMSPTANAAHLGSAVMMYSLTAGSNTFTAKYRVSGGTGNFSVRRIIVQSF